MRVVKNLPAIAGDIRGVDSIPGSGRSPGGGHRNPLQFSCLENPIDRGAWRAMVHGFTKSQTWLKPLSTHTTHTHRHACAHSVYCTCFFCSEAKIFADKSVNLFFSPFRCGFCWGPCLSQSLGHPVLDQLHYLIHHQTHSGPDSARSIWQGSGHCHVRRWPSSCASPRWMPKVRNFYFFNISQNLIISFKNKCFLWSSLFIIHKIIVYESIGNVNDWNLDSLKARHHFYERSVKAKLKDERENRVNTVIE